MKKRLSASVLLVTCFVFATSTVADNNLADRHAQKGFKCAQCHVEKTPSDAPKMESCLKCHGGSYEELGKASAEKKPNPHYTHMGDKECAVCHKGHMAPEFFCNNCHKFKLQGP